MKRRPLLVTVVAVALLLGAGGVWAGLSISGGGDENTGETPQVTLDGDEPVELEQPSPVVSGTADLPAGTELSIVIDSDGDGETEPFYAPNQATVDEDGAFSVTFEMQDVAPGREAAVRVYTEGGDGLLTETAAFVSVPWADVEPGESVVSFDSDEPIELDSHDAVVSGTVSVEEGTELAANLMSVPNADSPFFISQTAVADADGEFDVEFDLSNAVPGTEAELALSVPSESTQIGERDVVITESNESQETADDSDEVAAADLVELDEEAPIELVDANSTVTGTADGLGAGEEVELFVHEARMSGDDPDRVEATAPVDGDGEFAFDLDMSDAESGIAVELTVIHPEATAVYTVEGVVLESDSED